MNLKTVLITVCLISLENVKCEYFTSIDNLIKLAAAEEHFIQTLRRYVTKSHEKINLISSFLKSYQTDHDKIIESPQKYVQNPLNAYLLIQRLTLDLEDLLKIVSEYPEIAFLDTLKQITFPSREDFLGVATAIGRLQRTYNLTAHSLARGFIKEIQYDVSLDWRDCYEIALVLYNARSYELSIQWFDQTLIIGEDLLVNDDKILIMGYLSMAYIALKQYKKALDYNSKILQINPGFKRALDDKILLEKYVKEEKDEDKMADIEQNKGLQHKYQLLCSSHKNKLTKFKCRYKYKGNNKFLYLARLKEEDLSLDPLIRIYHDVVSHKESITLKGTAIPRLHRALVNTQDRPAKSPIRISEMTWLQQFEPIGVKIKQRAEDMIMLSGESSELIQVLNYGVGGHYQSHFDFHESPIIVSNSSVPENRIGTVLFYITTVEEGGATVFPMLDLKVEAVKGTALVWYNQLKSGSNDYRTLHGACPVLLGSKWVATVWFHDKGQSVLRPCDMVPEIDDGKEKWFKEAQVTENIYEGL